MKNYYYFAVDFSKARMLLWNPMNYKLIKTSDSMKVYQTNEIKNIALLGSKGSGKKKNTAIQFSRQFSMQSS